MSIAGGGQGTAMHAPLRFRHVLLRMLLTLVLPLNCVAAGDIPDPQARPFNPLVQRAALFGDAACDFAFRCFTGPAALEGDTAIIKTTNSALAVYARTSGDGWSFQQLLVDPDFPPNPFFVINDFGDSVGLSGDTLITNRDRSFPLEVFQRNNGIWSRSQLISGKVVVGRSIFVSEIVLDADTALVNVFYSYEAGLQGPSGAVLVFSRQRDGKFVQEAEILPNRNQAQKDFNLDVALQGRTALVSTIAGNEGRGEVYVYRRLGHRWLLRQTLRASDAIPGSQFGLSVQISGPRIVVAAPEQPNSRAPTRPGAIYTFVRTPVRWRLSDKLVAPPEQLSEVGLELEYSFASFLGLSGRRLLVGLQSRGNTFAFDIFPALLYERDVGQWSESGQITNTGEFSSVFHPILDGDTALVGLATVPFGSVAATYALPALPAPDRVTIEESEGAREVVEEAIP